MSERERIEFVLQRDGLEAALKFAEQGLAIYIQEALQRSPALKESVREWQQYLEAHGKKVKIVVVE